MEISHYCRKKDFHCIHNVKLDNGKNIMMKSEEIFYFILEGKVDDGVRKFWFNHFKLANSEKMRQTEQHRLVYDAWIDNNSDNTEKWSFDKAAMVYAKNGWEGFFSGPEIHNFLGQLTLTIYSKFGPSIVPRKEDLFNAFQWCPFDKLKVVIVGQDPYYSVCDGTPQAWGACFATRPGYPVQPSLKNVYDEVQNCYPNFKIPEDGDLRGWAKQGVLLLNSCLTTKPFEDKAHKNVWDSFIHFLFKKIREEKPGTIVLMWGREAAKVSGLLGALESLQTSHPSPKSAKYGFFGCAHFYLVNELLKKKKMETIDWCKVK